jgi:O-antigen biosynthesis protein
MKTSIIILTYNKLSYTKECIESIRKYTENGTYEIIVVDNHSEDATVDWLKDQEDIIKILNSENLGFPKGCNQGILISTGDNILLLNNDTVVTYNWLSNLTECLYSADNIGAVGPVTNYCSNAQTISISYPSMEEMQDFARLFNVSNPQKWEQRPRLVGYCLLIKKKVTDYIGLLDERFSPGNYEDNDYCHRMLLIGFKIILCKDTFIHHYGSKSFNDNFQVYMNLLETNRIKYEEKWSSF